MLRGTVHGLGFRVFFNVLAGASESLSLSLPLPEEGILPMHLDLQLVVCWLVNVLRALWRLECHTSPGRNLPGVMLKDARCHALAICP